MSSELVEFVKSEINSGKVVIFAKSGCPYCQLAKQVFDKLKESYKLIELDKRDDGPKIQNILRDITGERTVPRVFVNGQFVGGGTDVHSMCDSGELQKLLAG